MTRINSIIQQKTPLRKLGGVFMLEFRSVVFVLISAVVLVVSVLRIVLLTILRIILLLTVVLILILLIVILIAHNNTPFLRTPALLLLRRAECSAVCG